MSSSTYLNAFKGHLSVVKETRERDKKGILDRKSECLYKTKNPFDPALIEKIDRLSQRTQHKLRKIQADFTVQQSKKEKFKSSIKPFLMELSEEESVENMKKICKDSIKELLEEFSEI